MHCERHGLPATLIPLPCSSPPDMPVPVAVPVAAALPVAVPTLARGAGAAQGGHSAPGAGQRLERSAGHRGGGDQSGLCRAGPDPCLRHLLQHPSPHQAPTHLPLHSQPQGQRECNQQGTAVTRQNDFHSLRGGFCITTFCFLHDTKNKPHK